MLFVVSTLKLIAEVALLSLAGQWLLGLLAGARRDTNVFYRLLQVVTSPVVRLARWVSPRLVLDRHLPLVAFLLMGFTWVFATITKISICLQDGGNLCR